MAVSPTKEIKVTVETRIRSGKPSLRYTLTISQKVAPEACAASITPLSNSEKTTWT